MACVCKICGNRCDCGEIYCEEHVLECLDDEE